jgi:hypothetical protein
MGKKVFAGDFSSFDGTLNSGIMNEFVNTVNKFYDDGEENALVRQVLFMDVYNSIQLIEGVYINMTHSQPSGNPATTCLNSYYNSVSMRIAYKRAFEKARKEGRVTGECPPFADNISMVSYGDDNVVNLSDYVSTWFNQQSVTEAYASFGMTYTDETKSEQVVPYRTIEDVAYLKRHFRYDGALWRAPMALETILETPQWIRKTPDHIGATQMNVENSVMELAQHPESVFNHWAPKIIRAFYNETNMYPDVKTYDSYIEEWNYLIGLGTDVSPSTKYTLVLDGQTA